MAYFEDYQESGINPGYVEKEGDYELMIVGLREGKTPDGANYTQIECDINYKTRLRISVFLTEGRNFNGNFTAFCDTFGIRRGERPNDGWKGHTGFMHILLGQKNGFVTMTPRYIVGPDHFVLPEVKQAANGGSKRQQTSTFQNAATVPQVDTINEDQFGSIPF